MQRTTARTLRSIARGAIKTALALVAMLALSGCPDDPGEGAPEGGEALDEAAVKVEAAAEATATISEDNVDAVLEELEKQVEADDGSSE